MSAEFTLYAIPESQWARWRHLTSMHVLARDDRRELRAMVVQAHRDGRALFVAEVSYQGAMFDRGLHIPAAAERVLRLVGRLDGRPLTPRWARALTIAVATAPNRSCYRHAGVYWDSYLRRWRRHVPYWPRLRGVQRARVVRRWVEAHVGFRLAVDVE